MKNYREIILVVLIAALLGGGIYYLQKRVVFGRYVVENTTEEGENGLEQIACSIHDYMNGYLYGSGDGTALPQKTMTEVVNELQADFELIDQNYAISDSEEAALKELLNDFRTGFTNLQLGLAENNIKYLNEAHRIFEKLDYQVYHHKRNDHQKSSQ